MKKLCLCLLVLTGCAAVPPTPADVADDARVVNRLTWGLNGADLHAVRTQGLDAWIAAQLHPAPARLPAAVQARIDAMTISRRPLEDLNRDLEQRRKDADKIVGDEDKKAAQKAYQDELNRLAREAATRSLLRDLYSSDQVQEQMTWFWVNHFNVHQYKHNLRLMLGDYEDRAIRPRALGKFRDLLAATVYHPAMLRYLDNEQNAAGHLNENYARELMELHTLGVDGGYSQRDVQELACILTGVGVNLGTTEPRVRRERQAQYRHQGLFEFNPERHDYGDKVLLGQPVHGRGLAEVDEALDRLARHPSTARFISRKLAAFWVGDAPPGALVQRMAATFTASDGDIAAVLRVLFTSAEFHASLGHQFKDPVHYVVSAVRLAYGDKTILNAGPMLNWLNRMGQPPYGKQTPDGYPLTAAAWDSPGQLNVRFEIARAIGTGNAGLFKTDGPQPQEQPAFPQLANALYYQSIESRLAAGTRHALEQATSPQEWNSFLLSAPDMMYR
ncbi:DUF1800 domain-containing protein [Duganella sp. LX20W]|uniref:DUF1800 domain-containing protein n=1 Tax=Rugamonas brunnea TaxID=2758569 RepID=A0A7W2EWD6_9BURK|nr:DUF1800 domain-containing protein [Rugamonas brunnea]MBA5639811.1 DUF1800 domain-containing protein [Rugamonas brunnea]